MKRQNQSFRLFKNKTMKRIFFPNKINRNTLYQNIIPEIYNSIINKEFEFVFDMRETELADAESLIAILSISSIICNKYNHIPKLEMPLSIPILKYLERNDFFTISKMHGNQVLDFIKFSSFNDEIKNKKIGFSSKISNINNNSSISHHQTNVSKITYNLLQTSLEDKNKPNKWGIYKSFELSFLQLIQNFFEHNLYENSYKCGAYYLAQILPYGKIQVVFYDTGKGFRKRILEMIEYDNNKIKKGEDGNPDIDKYREIENLLRNNSLLFKNSNSNSNYVAIKAALNYRSGSIIPGLSVIRDFTFSLGGIMHIHSGNVQLDCLSDGTEKYKVFDYNFSGVHISLEFQL
jgi:hypothetical protein